MGLYAVDSQTGDLNLVAGSTMYASLPIGSIVPYGGSTAPAGWLLCQGQSLLRTDYPDLFNVIGTAFGSVDSTHFSLPDARECALVGSGQNGTHTIATHDTYTLGQFKDDQVQEHTHNINAIGTPSLEIFSEHIGAGTDAGYVGHDADLNNVANKYIASTITNGRKGSTTHGKQLGVNYIIKAEQIGAPADFISAAKALLKSITLTNMSVDSGGNVYLTGCDFTNKIPITFVPDNPGASILIYSFARYVDSIYINVNRKSGTISGTLYYYEK